MSNCEHDRQRQTCSVCSPQQVFVQYERKAKQRGLTFRLTVEEFERMIAEPCRYCGTYNTPRGLDRVDNRIGYTVSNVVPACGDCNFMKRTLPVHKFLDLVSQIAEHQKVLKRKVPTRSSNAEKN